MMDLTTPWAYLPGVRGGAGEGRLYLLIFCTTGSQPAGEGDKITPRVTPSFTATRKGGAVTELKKDNDKHWLYLNKLMTAQGTCQ